MVDIPTIIISHGLFIVAAWAICRAWEKWKGIR